MTHAWTLSIDSQWIAWLTFDLPDEKVNMLTADALAELDSLLDKLATDESIKAIVIRSGKNNSFIVGADIKELAKITTTDDAKAKSQIGQDVFNKLSHMPVPTIAAIHGTCLGGGMELALACSWRVVTDHPKTSLGLPEVSLGILPGWGGTQRLPALIGLPQSLNMILSGKPVNARKAWKIGLADGVIANAFLTEQTQDFINRVLSRVGRIKATQRRHKLQPILMRAMQATSLTRGIIYRKTRKLTVAKTNGHYPAPLSALDVICQTYRRTTVEDGLNIEAQSFSELACTAVSRNLVGLFQASQRMKKSGTNRAARRCEEINSIGVVGAGIMGGGIGWAFSNAGLDVRMKDINWDAVCQGTKAAAGMYRALVKRRKMSEGRMIISMHRIAGQLNYTGFNSLDVVVEAVVEDMAIKKKVLAEIEAHVSPDSIICTNTSSLPLDELASALKNPKRFVGLHFFNPVNRMPLVEVIPGRKTSQAAVVAIVELVKRIEKLPVVAGACPGFLVNRILLPYLVESAWMFEEGVDIQRLDHLLEHFGMPMGPLALVDEVGLDVGYKVAKVLESAYGERMHVPSTLGDVVESGMGLGKKTGRGFYVYHKGSKKPNLEISDLNEAARQRDGIVEHDLPDQDIVDRAILIMVNEAARCIDEHIVDDAEQLDMAMIMGTGFAPFRGGLLRYADTRGLPEITERLDTLAASYGERFTPAPLLTRMARKKRTFYRDRMN